MNVPAEPNENRAIPSVVGDVLADISASPTPYHAVARAVSILEPAGFRGVDLGRTLPVEPGSYYAAQGGSLVAWRQQQEHRGFTIVGAHTDSPNLRVKSHPDVVSAGVAQIGMEIYGGVLLNSWLDRDLGLAGRVSVATSSGVAEQMFCDERPLMVVPQLAIHLDRDILSNGLKLNPQKHLAPMWALAPPTDDRAEADGTSSSVGALRHHLATVLEVPPEDILAWDLMAFDVQPPSIIGRDGDLFSTARIDNLLSTFCGVRALVELEPDHSNRTSVLALYDHEEVGSESATGAAGAFLASVLERIATAEGASRSEYLTALNQSMVVSVDGAHATNPNYVDRHEPSHRVALNGGIVIKRNANQRYATDARSEAFIVDVCRRADVPLQWYIHRNDLPCGSTIGPITAGRLAIPAVDIGAPQLAMHSIRETAGVLDVVHLLAAIGASWTAP